MKCGVTVSSPHSDSQQNIFVDSVPKQPDDFQFIQSIKQRIVGFPICTIPGKHTEHGLHAVTPLHAPGAVAVGAGGDFGIVLDRKSVV